MTTFTSRWNRESIARHAPTIAQALLATIFLFAGASKFLMSSEQLTKDTDLSVAFLRFIGACEILGALGLVLPGVSGIARGLTPIAAVGLIIIMVGATVITVATMGVAPALFPFVVGVTAAFVAFTRRSWLAPTSARTTREYVRGPSPVTV